MGSPVKRKKILTMSEDLKNNDWIETLTRNSRLFGENLDKAEKEKFTIWVKKIYLELIEKSTIAKIIMRILTCSRKLKITYMPKHSNICDIKNTGKAKSVVDGITYGRVEQIIIAVGNYKDESKTDELKGLIIHEFCHYVIYETFCNKFNPYYENDTYHKEKWNEAAKECEKNKTCEFLIQEAFHYNQQEWQQELAVRYYQYQIQIQENYEKLSYFKSKFSLLSEICEEYVLNEFHEEFQKIQAVRKLNKILSICDNPLHTVKMIDNDIGLDLDYSHPIQIVKTSHPTLMVNYIFHKLKELHHFQSKFVFLHSKDLIENYNYECLKLAINRKVRTTFVIDCNFRSLECIESKLKMEVEQTANCHVILILRIDQTFDINSFNFKKCFTPNDLTEDFINELKINFQYREILMTDLMSLEEFKSLNSLPFDYSHTELWSIGNHNELKLCKYYVDRAFLIKFQKSWIAFDNMENVFENHQRVLIANEPGAGKSIESVHMFFRFKAKFPSLWIIYVNLSDLFGILNNDKLEISKASFYRQILMLGDFESEIFDLSLKKGRVIFIFDSLDEIAPLFLEKVEGLIDIIFTENKSQRIVIFTRPHLVENMKNFQFTEFKLEDIGESTRKQLIENILRHGNVRELEFVQKKVETFLKDTNLHTPLLIKMVIEVSTLSSFNNKSITIYDIYDKFIKKFRRTTDEKSQYIEAENFEIQETNKYFQNYAINNLIIHWDDSINNIKVRKQSLIDFKDFHLDEIIDPDAQTLQRIGVVYLDSDSKLKFIHASFNDFYIAQFIKDHIKYFSHIKNHTELLLQLLTMLSIEDRLKNVLRFLENFKKVIVYLKEYEVIYQMLTRSKEPVPASEVNIAPIIEYIVEIMTNHLNLKNICMEKKISLFNCQFSDPMKTLDDLYSCNKKTWKSYGAWKLYVNENILMNKRNINLSHSIFNRNKRESNFAMNILDVLAECGKKGHSNEYFIANDEFKEYFKRLTHECFDNEQIVKMLKPCIGPEPDYRKSFFLMAQSPNQTVRENFLDLFESYIFDIKIFSNPSFFAFNALFILNNNFKDFQKLKVNMRNVAKMNEISVTELIFSEDDPKVNWLEILSENIERSSLSPEIFSTRLINFINENIEGYCLFKMLITKINSNEIPLFSLLNSLEYEFFNYILEKTLEIIPNSTHQILLSSKNNSNLTILQVFASRVSKSVDQLNHILQTYKTSFNETSLKIVPGLFLESHFINEFLNQIKSINIFHTDQLIQSNILSTIDVILHNLEGQQKQFICSRDNRGDTILTAIARLKRNELLEKVLALCSQYHELELINLFIQPNFQNDSFITMLILSEEDFFLEESVIKVLYEQSDFNENHLTAIHELFSNRLLTEDKLNKLIMESFEMEKEDIHKIYKLFTFKLPLDSSSILIAAAKCRKSGRINTFIKCFGEYLFDESFEKCFNDTDNNGFSALSYLLTNEFQDNDFLLLFEKVELFYAYDQAKLHCLVKKLMFSSGENSNKMNMLFNILRMNQNGIKKASILKLMEYLEVKEKETLIMMNNVSLLIEFVRTSFSISMITVEPLLNAFFQNDKVYDQTIKKLEDSSENKCNKALINKENLLKAFQFYRTNQHRTMKSVKMLLNRINGRPLAVTFFRDLLSKNYKVNFNFTKTYNKQIVPITKYFEGDLRNVYSTFFYLLSIKENWHLLENVEKRNVLQMKRYREVFDLVKFILNDDSKKIKIQMKKQEMENLTPLQLAFKEGSVDLQREILKCHKEVFYDIEEYQEYLFTELNFNLQQNILHVLFSKQDVNFNNSKKTFKLIIDQFKSPQNTMEKIFFQENFDHKTSLSIAFSNSNLDTNECIEFFAYFLDDGKIRNLMKREFENNKKVFRQILGRCHSPEIFKNSLDLITKYLSEHEQSPELLLQIIKTERRKGETLIHELFSHGSSCKCDSLMQLYNCLKNRETLKEILKSTDEHRRTPLRIASESSSNLFSKYLKILETMFFDDHETIRLFLTDSNKSSSILYSSLLNGSFESRKFAIEFHQKYFNDEDFSQMLRKAFQTVDNNDNNLFHLLQATEKYDDASFYFFCDIIKEHMKGNSLVKFIYEYKNKDGETPVQKGLRFHKIFDDITVLENKFLPKSIIVKILKVRNKKHQSILSTIRAIDSDELGRIESLLHENEFFTSSIKRNKKLIKNKIQTFSEKLNFSKWENLNESE